MCTTYEYSCGYGIIKSFALISQFNRCTHILLFMHIWLASLLIRLVLHELGVHVNEDGFASAWMCVRHKHALLAGWGGFYLISTTGIGLWRTATRREKRARNKEGRWEKSWSDLYFPSALSLAEGGGYICLKRGAEGLLRFSALANQFTFSSLEHIYFQT